VQVGYGNWAPTYAASEEKHRKFFPHEFPEVEVSSPEESRPVTAEDLLKEQ
jgi:hypothetical protein